MGCDYYLYKNLIVKYLINGKNKSIDINLGSEKRWFYSNDEDKYEEALKKRISEEDKNILILGSKSKTIN